MTLNKIKEKNFIYQDFSKSELQVKLARVSRICENFKIPVMILIDGWESSGRGHVVSEITKELNPKFFDVDVCSNDDSDGEFSFIRNAWKNVPAQSHIKIFTHSYYYDLFDNVSYKEEEIKSRLEEIENLEKMLTDNKTIIIKIFLDIDEDEQEKRI